MDKGDGSALPGYVGHLHVAAAVIEDGAGRILLAKRPKHLHQGGLWEFPGGKVEPGESCRDALSRELQEELGIQLRKATPLIRIPYCYPDKKVLLDVWRVSAFNGEPHGAEGQAIRWVGRDELPAYAFPAANAPIITAARLPERYLITPEPGEAAAWPLFLERLERAFANGIRLVQLRAHALAEADYRRLADKVVKLAHRYHARVLLNAPPERVAPLQADGVHLSSRRLLSLKQRPLGAECWVAASCHNQTELQKALSIGVDFIVASPVKATASHPGAVPLDWDGFHRLTEQATVPVYALGGMSEADLAEARQHGGQGIAAIRELWPKRNNEGGLPS
jgi:8-oxo-dGTP diphosphatase